VRPVEGGHTVTTSDGVPIAIRCWARTAPTATVVICHGFTANKDDPAVVALAERLRERGYRVVAYDARGHGSSGGSCTLGTLERLDVTAVVDWARTGGDRVVLVGASLGAVAALSYAAAGADSLAGVVAVSSPGDWRLPPHVRSLVTAGLARTRLGRRWAMHAMNLRIGRWTRPDSARTLLPSVGCPVVVVHGSADPIIPTCFSLAHGMEVGPFREVVLVPGMGHAFDRIGLPTICEAADRLIDRGRFLADR
jgi:pimeloyl-ACP methyl ester carboxylesterase